MEIRRIISEIENGNYDNLFLDIYVDEDKISYQKQRYIKAIESYIEEFGEDDVEIYSAPGRSEVGGNHTDHQHGEILAASINLDAIGIDQWVKAGTGQEKTRSSKRWSDFSLYTDENSSEVTTISELFGFYEFIFGVIPMLSSSSASSSRLWTFSFLYAFLR